MVLIKIYSFTEYSFVFLLFLTILGCRTTTDYYMPNISNFNAIFYPKRIIELRTKNDEGVSFEMKEGSDIVIHFNYREEDKGFFGLGIFAKTEHIWEYLLLQIPTDIPVGKVLDIKKYVKQIYFGYGSMFSIFKATDIQGTILITSIEEKRIEGHLCLIFRDCKNALGIEIVGRYGWFIAKMGNGDIGLKW